MYSAVKFFKNAKRVYEFPIKLRKRFYSSFKVEIRQFSQSEEVKQSGTFLQMLEDDKKVRLLHTKRKLF